MNPAKQVRRPGAPSNEFFLDGEGINRQVLQTELCKFLGNDAISRPFEHENRRGFKITAVRPFTSAMIEDLKTMSAEYETEASRYKAKGQEVQPYERSKTRRNVDNEMIMPRDPREPYSDPRYISNQDYAAYPQDSYQQYPPGYPPQQGYAPQQGFPQGGPYPPQNDFMQYSSAAQVHGMTTTAHGRGYPGEQQYPPHYTYGPGMPNPGMPGQGYYRPPFEPPRTRPDDGQYPPGPTAGGRGEDMTMNSMPDGQYPGAARPPQQPYYDPNTGSYAPSRRR